MRITRGIYLVWLLSGLGLLLAPSSPAADETNHLSLSGRVGLNISARFKGVKNLALPSNNQKTPNGDAYNYDDGYVLTDISGNFGGQSWYWGYNNSASQISGNNILLSRSALAGATPDSTANDSPGYGAEVVYQHLWNASGRLRYGAELAGNYLNVSLSDSTPQSANLSRTTYPFAFTPGTTPPSATPSSPYQGSFQGPGFVIGATPGSPTTSVVPGGATIVGNRDFTADIFGFHLGPCLEYSLSDSFTLSLSGGLAAALVDGKATWHETVFINNQPGPTLSGSGRADDFLVGFYVGGSATWQFADHWGVVGGAQFQDLGNFNHSFSGREVELNLSHTIFVSLGVTYGF